MDKQKLLTLLTKYEKNECTEEEISVLKKWFQGFPEIKEDADLFEGEPEENVRNRIWEHVSRDFEYDSGAPRQLNWWYKVASAVAVFLLIGIYWTQFRKDENTGNQSDFISVRSARDTVLYLPDSSRLLLEPNSVIRYSRGFLYNRTVYLEGGGLFHVRKKLSAPFQVVSKEQITTVTGTIFSIKAYPGDNQVTTHLLEGSVRITHGQKADSMDLAPNEIAVYLVGSGKFTKLDNAAPAPGRPATTKPQLLFNGTTYEEIFATLETRFGVTIYIDRANLKECYFSAKFQTETLEEVLSILASINHFKYHITGNIVYVEDFEC